MLVISNLQKQVWVGPSSLTRNRLLSSNRASHPAVLVRIQAPRLAHGPDPRFGNFKKGLKCGYALMGGGRWQGRAQKEILTPTPPFRFCLEVPSEPKHDWRWCVTHTRLCLFAGHFGRREPKLDCFRRGLQGHIGQFSRVIPFHLFSPPERRRRASARGTIALDLLTFK